MRVASCRCRCPASAKSSATSLRSHCLINNPCLSLPPSAPQPPVCPAATLNTALSRRQHVNRAAAAGSLKLRLGGDSDLRADDEGAVHLRVLQIRLGIRRIRNKTQSISNKTQESLPATRTSSTARSVAFLVTRPPSLGRQGRGRVTPKGGTHAIAPIALGDIAVCSSDCSWRDFAPEGNFGRRRAVPSRTTRTCSRELCVPS